MPTLLEEAQAPLFPQEQQPDAATLRQQAMQPLVPSQDEMQLQRERDFYRAVPEGGTEWMSNMVPFLGAAFGAARDIEYGQSLRRHEAGQSQGEDLRNIARHEEQQRRDANLPLGDRILHGLAHVPAMVGEAAVGGAAVSGLARAFPRALGWAAPAAAEGTASLLTRAGLQTAARNAPANLGRAALMTPAMPSMYLEGWTRNNLEAGRDPTDIRGLPAALAMGTLQNAILGSLGQFGNSITGRGILPVAKRLIARTGIGMVEQQAVDVLASGIADLLPFASELHTGYGLGGELFRGIRRGNINDFLGNALVQAVTFAAFSAIHEVRDGAPKPREIVQAATEAAKEMKTEGATPKEAGDRLNEINKRWQDALTSNDNLTREEALALFTDIPPGPEHDYALKLANTRLSASAHQRAQGPRPGVDILPEPPKPMASMEDVQAIGKQFGVETKILKAGKREAIEAAIRKVPGGSFFLEAAAKPPEAPQPRPAPTAEQRAESLWDSATPNGRRTFLGQNPNQVRPEADQTPRISKTSWKDLSPEQKQAALVHMGIGTHPEAPKQAKTPAEAPKPVETPPEAAPEAAPKAPEAATAPLEAVRPVETPPVQPVAPPPPQKMSAMERLMAKGRGAQGAPTKGAPTEPRKIHEFKDQTDRERRMDAAKLSDVEKAVVSLRDTRANPPSHETISNDPAFIKEHGQYTRAGIKAIEKRALGKIGEHESLTESLHKLQQGNKTVKSAVEVSQERMNADKEEAKRQAAKTVDEHLSDIAVSWGMMDKDPSDKHASAMMHDITDLAAKVSKKGGNLRGILEKAFPDIPAQEMTELLQQAREAVDARGKTSKRFRDGSTSIRRVIDESLQGPSERHADLAQGQETGGQPSGSAETTPPGSGPAGSDLVAPRTVNLLADVLSSGNKYMLEKVKKAMGHFYSPAEIDQALAAAKPLIHPDRGAEYRDQRGAAGRPPENFRGHNAQNAEGMLIHSLQAAMEQHLIEHTLPTEIADANKQLKRAGEVPLTPSDYSEIADSARRQDEGEAGFFAPRGAGGTQAEQGNLIDFAEGGGIYGHGHVGERGFLGDAGKQPSAEPLYRSNERGDASEQRQPGDVEQHVPDPWEFPAIGPIKPGESSLPGGGQPNAGDAHAMRVTALAKDIAAAEHSKLYGVTEPLPQHEHVANLKRAEKALATMEADPAAAPRLLADLEKKPRALGPDEGALLLAYKTSLDNAMTKAMNDWSTVISNPKLRAGMDVADLARLEKVADDHVQQFAHFLAVVKKSGSQTGAGLQMFAQLMKEDFSLAGLIRQATVAKGEPLSEAEKVKFGEMATRIADLQKKLEESQAAYQESIKPKEAPKASNDVPKSDEPKSKLWEFADKMEQSARARLKAKLGDNLFSGFDPTLVADLAQFVAAKIIKGTYSFAEFSKAIVGRFGKDVEPHIQEIWDKANEHVAEATKTEAQPKPTPKPAQPKADPTAPAYVKMRKAEVQSVQSVNDAKKAMAELKNARKTWFERLSDVLIKSRINMVISGLTTIGKITTASAERVAIAPLEQAAGVVWAHIPGVAKIAAMAPREGGGSWKNELKATASAWTDGLKDAWRTIRTGESELDVLHGKDKDTPRTWLDLQFSLHAAAKAPAVRAEYTRSLLERIDHAAKNGEDTTSTAALMRMSLLAYKDSQAAKFQQENWLVEAYNKFTTTLRDPKGPMAAQVTGTALRLLTPVVRIPTNLAFETAKYVFGTGTGAVQATRAYMRGLENLKPAEADAIMQQFKKGSLGMAVLLIGAMNPTMFGGYYAPRRREDDVPAGAVRIGGVTIPAWTQHNPMLQVFQIGATFRRAFDKEVRQDGKAGATGTAAWEAMQGWAEEIPLVRETGQIAGLTSHNARTRGYHWGEMAKSMAVPQLFQWLAGRMDTKQGTPFGDTNKRHPIGVMQHIQTGIPGLRNQVPLGR